MIFLTAIYSSENMDIQDFENNIKNKIVNLILKIIADKPILQIDVKKGERVGDGISKYLEYQFVEYTKNHDFFNNSKSSPSGKTKNP
jgi:hypothetical protein